MGGLDHAAQRVRIQLCVAAPPECAEAHQITGVLELIQTLGAAPGAPEHLLVFAADEAADVEAKPRVRSRVEP